MKKLAAFFLLAYSISWLIWLPLILPGFGIYGLPVLPHYHHYLGSFGPMLAALILTYRESGAAGVRMLLKRLVKWKVAWKWYFWALLAPVLLVLLAGHVEEALYGRPFSMQGFGTNAEFPGFDPLAFFLFNLFTFGIGEETGWRGYALPALQKRYDSLVSTLLLTVFWASWHLPAFAYRPQYSQMGPADLMGFFLSLATGAIILTWLYNSTFGSLLIVSLFHAMIELMFMSSNVSSWMTSFEGAAIMTGAILIILIAKPRHLSAIARQKAT